MNSKAQKYEEGLGYRSERERTLIESHMKADQFFCPKAFDLSFWGQRGDSDFKELTLVATKKTSSSKAFEDKELLLLYNNKRARVADN